MSVLNEGDYWCQIVSATMTESQVKKSPQLSILIRVESEAVGGAWQPLARVIDRTLHFSLTEGAWPYSQKKLAALGFNGNFDAPAFTESHAQFFMQYESYGGKDREKWELAKWGEGGDGLQPAGKDVTRKFNALWMQSQGAAMKRPAGKPPAPPTRAPGSTTVAASPDEVPF